MRCLWEHPVQMSRKRLDILDLGLSAKSGLEAHNGKINIMRYLGHETG